MKREQKITSVLFIVYIILLSWIILFKLQFSIAALDHIRNINVIPFSGSDDFDEVINNVIVFIPVGIYLEMLKPDWSCLKLMLPIVGISFVYETCQFLFSIGVTDITDIITNTFGGIIGIGIFLVLSKILKEKTTKILHVLASICTFLVVGLFVLLLIANH